MHFSIAECPLPRALLYLGEVCAVVFGHISRDDLSGATGSPPERQRPFGMFPNRQHYLHISVRVFPHPVLSFPHVNATTIFLGIASDGRTILRSFYAGSLTPSLRNVGA